MCTYCDVDDGHPRTQCPTRQESEIGTDRQLDDPLAVCPDCGTANNRSVNDSCWKCGHEFPDREIRADGGTRTQSDRLAGWNPQAAAETAPRCRNCGNQVTRQFARVFGDNRDVIHSCPDCATYREMQTAAVPEEGEDQ